VTVKRFKRSGRRITLIAENPDYEDIEVEGELEIEGRVVGLIRNGEGL